MVPLFVAAIAAACGDTATAVRRSRPPPLLTLNAATRVLSAGAVNELEVSASLRNETTTQIRVAVGSECPLYVRIFPDPTGEAADSLSSSWACALDGRTIALVPGDTAVLTRVLGADTLASFAPGRYGVDVAVTTSTGLIGKRAGTIQLPLPSSP